MKVKRPTIGVLGAGAMGKLIVKDLLKTFDGKVVILSHDPQKIKSELKTRNILFADATDPKSLEHALKKIDLVIHSVHHEYNLNVMKACLKTQTHYLDLGGLYHYTRKQLKLSSAFRKAGLIAVLGMGAAPGITNVLAHYGARFFDEIETVEIKVGSKDQSIYKTQSPLSNSYSIQTILEECSWNPAVFTKKKIKWLEPFSGRKPYRFPQPIGIQKPQYTIHSEIATLPYTLPAKNVSFQIAFEDSLIEKVQALRSLGFLEKENLLTTSEILKHIPKPIPKQYKQFEILRVNLEGVKNKKKKKIVMDARIYTFKESLDKDTAVPASIVAQMVLNKIIEKRGAFPPESIVPEQIFFEELAKRHIFIYKNHHPIL